MIKVAKCIFSLHFHFTFKIKNQWKEFLVISICQADSITDCELFLWSGESSSKMSSSVWVKLSSARFFQQGFFSRQDGNEDYSGLGFQAKLIFKVKIQKQDDGSIQCRWRGEGSFVTFPYFWLLRYISSQFLNKCFTTIFLKLNSL